MDLHHRPYASIRRAIEAGCHFSDLCGNTEIVFEQKKLNDAAVAKGLSIIPDCGLAPMSFDNAADKLGTMVEGAKLARKQVR